MAYESASHVKTLLEKKEAYVNQVLVLFKSYIDYNKRNAIADNRPEYCRISESIENVLNKGNPEELEFICKSIQPKSSKNKSPKRPISQSNSLEKVKAEPIPPNSDSNAINQIAQSNNANQQNVQNTESNLTRPEQSSEPESTKEIPSSTTNKELNNEPEFTNEMPSSTTNKEQNNEPEPTSEIILLDSPDNNTDVEIVDHNSTNSKTTEPICSEFIEPSESLIEPFSGLDNTVDDLSVNQTLSKSCSEFDNTSNIGSSSELSFNSSFNSENDKFQIKDCFVSLESRDLIISNYQTKRSRNTEDDNNINRNSKSRRVKKQANNSECSKSFEEEDFSLSKRRLTDPKVGLEIILDKVMTDMLLVDETEIFWKPVSAKEVPDYYKIIKKPIDLTIIRDRVKAFHYKDRHEFLFDIELIHSNSVLYNGACHIITFYAEKIVDECKGKMKEYDVELTKLEKLINPLLSDDPINGLNYILMQVLENNVLKVKTARAFWEPVNPKTYPDYYDLIKNPIDLEQINKKLIKKMYKSKEMFIRDLAQLKSNCVQYNGECSSYTKIAKKLLDACRTGFNTHRETIENLENQME